MPWLVPTERASKDAPEPPAHHADDGVPNHVQHASPCGSRRTGHFGTCAVSDVIVQMTFVRRCQRVVVLTIFILLRFVDSDDSARRRCAKFYPFVAGD